MEPGTRDRKSPQVSNEFSPTGMGKRTDQRQPGMQVMVLNPTKSGISGDTH